MTQINTDQTVTTAVFAEKFGLTVDTVKIYCQRGVLNATKVGGRFGVWLIDKDEVARFRKERRSRGRPKQ